MDAIEQLVIDAWQRIMPRVLADPHELRRRLARRRQITFRRPPRAFCLAVRASDTRIDFHGTVYPEHAVDYTSEYHSGRVIEHEVRLEPNLLQVICKPVEITPPGEDWRHVAQRLGVHPETLRYAMNRGALRVTHMPVLGGKRGRPVPHLYCRHALDPASANFHQPPDPVWSRMWQTHVERLPEDLAQDVVRVPVYRNHPAQQPGPRKHPPPAWSEGLDPVAIRIERMRRKRASSYDERMIWAIQASDPAVRFRGWRWRCPACRQRVRVLYYPLPMPSIPWFYGVDPAITDADVIEPPNPTFACVRCHRVHYFTRMDQGSWNMLVGHLSGGLLYGHEVKPPDWYKPTSRQLQPRKRIGKPKPAPRRNQVLQHYLAGHSDKHIALSLHMTPQAVRAHIKTLLKRHQVHCRADLAAALQRPAPPPEPLSRRPAVALRRRKVAALRKQGLPYTRIAADLGVSVHVVHHDLKHLRRTQRAGSCRPGPKTAVSG